MCVFGVHPLHPPGQQLQLLEQRLSSDLASLSSLLLQATGQALPAYSLPGYPQGPQPSRSLSQPSDIAQVLCHHQQDPVPPPLPDCLCPGRPLLLHPDHRVPATPHAAQKTVPLLRLLRPGTGLVTPCHS